MVVTVLQILHLLVVGVWVGAMAYSLTVVQPKVDRFVPDDRRREELLTVLADGNRWKVVPLVATLLVTAAAVALLTDRGTVAAGYGVALVLYLAAAGVFVNVSWRHWPARVFATTAELPAFRRSLRVQAWVMLTLASSAFVVTLAVSVG